MRDHNTTEDGTELDGFVAALNGRDGVRAAADPRVGDSDFQIVVDAEKTGLSFDLAEMRDGPATITHVSHTTEGVRYEGNFDA